MTPADIIVKLRKEIGGADPGTIYGDVLALCDAYEELAGQCGPRGALRRIVKWAVDTEDVDFYARDNPQDTDAIKLLHEIVLRIGVPK